MRRRRFLAGLALLPALLPGGVAAVEFAPVRPGRLLRFPADHGAHPDFRTEWWYATGWLRRADGRPLGFQITFFRVRTGIGEASPSRFAPRQLLLAHAALADPALGRLRQAERAARTGFGRAAFATTGTDVAIGDWRLWQADGSYHTRARGEDFTYALTLAPDVPPLLHGRGGFSAKAPDPRHASYYYSRPRLRVAGQVEVAGRSEAVTGHAWLDHEWSSELLPAGAQGWDWTGINLAGGGALMAFRLRDHAGEPLWAAATLRTPDGAARTFGPGEVAFTPLRRWRSPRTGVDYPVVWRLALPQRHLLLEPLLDDQELDSRHTTGAIYWEGAVRASEDGRPVGEGYLELTGYGERMRLGPENPPPSP